MTTRTHQKAWYRWTEGTHGTAIQKGCGRVGLLHLHLLQLLRQGLARQLRHLRGRLLVTDVIQIVSIQVLWAGQVDVSGSQDVGLGWGGEVLQRVGVFC